MKPISEYITARNIRDIRVIDTFKSIFSINREVLDKVAEDMRINGFDISKPLSVWARNGECVLIDGHTRLMAAREAGMTSVPVIAYAFDSDDEAFFYAVHCQVARRNLEPAEIIQIVAEVDRRKAPEFRGNQYLNSGEASRDASPNQGKSATTTAALLGVSSATVERARTINDHATPEIKEKIKSGEIKSVNAGYKATIAEMKKKDQPDPMAAENKAALDEMRAEQERSDEAIDEAFDELVTRFRADELRVLVGKIDNYVRENG